MQRQIIIVSHDRPFRDALERVCSGQGCRVATAGSVAVALKSAVRGPVRVMISDASVQNAGDGVGLAKAIHAQSPDVTCFLIVDEEDSGTADAVKSEPWMRLVSKPVRMLCFSGDVVDAINRCQEGIDL